MKLIKHYDFENHQDLSDFNVEVGDKWANNEVQRYRNHPDNLFFNEEGLNIRATLENDIVYSARLNTKGKFYFQYGRIDIIAKLPKGKGTWPALWMMSEENRYGRWPKSGEIDIMEHTGNDLGLLYYCIHTEAYNHRLKEQYYYTLTKEDVADDFQTFSLKWDETSITYLLNEKVIHRYQKGENGKDTSHEGWPFDAPFYIIMNLAIGGSLGGNVDYKSFPQTFTIKDIKVFQ
ncbi:MAG: family 16 glycosylhydrolase [Candidatus Izemoplasmataceae bacterium]